MKHRKEAMTALVCCLLILAFVTGMRAGRHDEEIRAAERQDAAVSAAVKSAILPYDERIKTLEAELEAEKQIEHVVYDYVPMAVDYPTVSDVPVNDIVMLAQTGIGEDTLIDERPWAVAAVYETIFNRVDSPDPYFPDTVAEVITQPNAFLGYSPNKPVDERYYNLAIDCWYRWQIKKLGVGDPGYTIPYDLVSFHGDGKQNHFMRETEWLWTLPNPYADATKGAELK